VSVKRSGRREGVKEEKEEEEDLMWRREER